MSISDGLPMSIEAVLEGVNRGGIDDMLRKTVPRTDDPLTEKVFPEIETGSVEDSSRLCPQRPCELSERWKN